MNPEIQDRLNTITTYILDNSIKAGEFVKEQAPQVAREIIAWGFWEGLLWTVFHAFIVLLFTILFTVVIKKMVSKGITLLGSSRDELGFALTFPGILIAAGMAAVVLYNISCIPTTISRCIKASVAPKVYLLEQIKTYTTSK